MHVSCSVTALTGTTMVVEDSLSFSCELDGENSRLFAYSILCLSKIGTDITFEITNSHVSIRSLNDANTAFSLFTLSSSFFQHFNKRSTKEVTQSTSSQYSTAVKDTIYCKLSLKRCLCVFKSCISAKNLDKLKISLLDRAHKQSQREKEQHKESTLVSLEDKEDMVEEVIVFSLCVNSTLEAELYNPEYQDIIKEYEFSCETIEDVYDIYFNKANLKEGNEIVFNTLILQNIFKYLRNKKLGTSKSRITTEEEIILHINSRGVTFSSVDYGDRSEVNKEIDLHTHIQVDREDLELFSVKSLQQQQQEEDEEAIELKFSVREVKALVSFCELSTVDSIKVSFTEPGAPILLSTATSSSPSSPSFTAEADTVLGEVILATCIAEEYQEEEEEEKTVCSSAVSERTVEMSRAEKRKHKEVIDSTNTVLTKENTERTEDSFYPAVPNH